MEDYQKFLDAYYEKLSPDEKLKYFKMVDIWRRESFLNKMKPSADPFERPGRFRFATALYGLYYGIAASVLLDLEDEAAVAVPLMTSGLWLMGPVINPRKYEGVTSNTLRLVNTGRFLGLLYGGSLGLALGGDEDNAEDVILASSSLMSIGLGEAAFAIQKDRNFSAGQIDLMRHYSFLSGWTALALTVALSDQDERTVGASVLAGGVSGLFIGHGIGTRYDYTRGDVDAIGSLSTISAGLGFAAVYERLDETEDSDLLILIPAVASIAGSVAALRSVQGAYLTDRQGTTINLATSGAALVGLGISLLLETESPLVFIGLTSALAFIMHQKLFYQYKWQNINSSPRGRRSYKKPFQASLQLKPENYFMGTRMAQSSLFETLPSSRFNFPIATLRFTF